MVLSTLFVGVVSVLMRRIVCLFFILCNRLDQLVRILLWLFLSLTSDLLESLDRSCDLFGFILWEISRILDDKREYSDHLR